jgi:hypothetical protein
MCVCETYKAKIRLTVLRSENWGGENQTIRHGIQHISTLATDDLVP